MTARRRRRGFALLGHGMVRGTAVVVLAAVLALAVAVGVALRSGDDGAEVRAFARGYAAAHAAAPADAADLPGRVEYAARRGPEGLADLYRDVRRSTEATRAALARLATPAGYRAELERLTRLLAQQSAALERLVQATTSQDRGALTGATRELARTAALTRSLRARIEQRLAGATTS